MVNTAFSQEQFNAIYPEGIENHYWNHARNRIIRKVLRKNKLCKGKILEIGCGKGVVVEYLRGQKIDCYGVELGDVKPHSTVARFIYTSTDAFALPRDFRDSVDTIMVLDVLEHLENPANFIDTVLSSFKNASGVLVTVPARQELWTNYDTYNGHYRRYSLKDINNQSNERLSVQEAGYFNHILYPFFLAIARLIRKRGTEIKAPSGIGIPLHRMLSIILRLDFALLSRKLRGTSIIALLSVRKD